MNFYWVIPIFVLEIKAKQKFANMTATFTPMCYPLMFCCFTNDLIDAGTLIQFTSNNETGRNKTSEINTQTDLIVLTSTYMAFKIDSVKMVIGHDGFRYL